MTLKLLKIISQAEAKIMAHYPGKEKINPGFHLFRAFESNVPDKNIHV